ncbi:MAG: NAD(+) synthase [Clostridia bacterium]|nr:NAD(+) synthase [Clostridia bacterium]
MDDVVQRIKKYKQMFSITSEELSKKSKIPLGTLNKILSSSTKSIKTETLAAIASGLGVTVSDLVGKEKRGETYTATVSEPILSYCKVAAVTPEIKVGDVEKNTKAIIDAIEEYSIKRVKVLVFPELCLSGYTASDLFYMDTLLKACEKSLVKIADNTVNCDTLVFVGSPLKRNGKLYNCAVAICKGKILGVVPKKFIPSYNEFYEKRQFSVPDEENSTIFIQSKEYPFGNKLIFRNKYYPEMKVAAEICEDLWTVKSPSCDYAVAGANVIVNLSASDEIIGKAEYRRKLVSMQSAKCVAAYVYSDAGTGESSTDMVFSGHNLIAENGKLLSESEIFGDGVAVADVDLGFLEYERSKLFNYSFGNTDEYKFIEFTASLNFDRTDRKYEKTPFVPVDDNELKNRINLILNIQSEGLARRVKHTNCKTLVIGLSGGLDSTLALLVACRAMDKLSRKRKDIIAISMPCFGTTDRTKNNAKTLAEQLGTTYKEINITESVKSHFKDIGQNEKNTDVTYENSQARERTQVLMDIANKSGGLVVGTGDLSELALGWATYNGDHMSMYGVNASVPKTLVRYIVKHVAEESKVKTKKVLLDILDTPVSPELIPAENGEIKQKTEDIVGPYVLHDFFLYHFVRSGFAPSKIFKIAEATFEGEYDSKTIYKWLETFIKRFFAQQFKRSCLPDGVKVGSVALSPRGDWRMPSDASAEIWLKDLRRVK